jgi:hypothetical protein
MDRRQFNKLTVTAGVSSLLPNVGNNTVQPYNVEVFDDDSQNWYLNGDLRLMIAKSGTKRYCTKRYYKEGELHRDGDEPAIEYSDGTKYYYKEGLPHRDGDKPAIEWPDGTKYYYKEKKEISFSAE